MGGRILLSRPGQRLKFGKPSDIPADLVATAKEWREKMLEAAAEAEFTVFGMGKFGGVELNFSSDIDLVFVYPEEGETAGAFTLQLRPRAWVRPVTRAVTLGSDTTGTLAVGGSLGLILARLIDLAHRVAAARRTLVRELQFLAKLKSEIVENSPVG